MDPIQQIPQPNSWLSDPKFFEQITYEDKAYLSSLFEELKKSFLYICPIKITLKYDLKRNAIIFYTRKKGTIGTLDVDRMIRPFDFCILAFNVVRHLFPHYEVEYENDVHVKRDPSEIIDIMQKDPSATLEGIMYKTEKQKTVEKAIIEKIYVLDDQFRIIINGIPQIRHCKRPITRFLRSYRHMVKFLAKRKCSKIEIFKKQYIDKYSSILHEVHFFTEAKELFMPAYQMKNFFRINYPSLRNHELIFNPATNKYQWERYILDFPTLRIQQECVELLKKLKEEDQNG